MPLTEKGQKVMAAMQAEYGGKKGTSFFYASINAKKKGSKQWEKHSYSSKEVDYARNKRNG